MNLNHLCSSLLLRAPDITGIYLLLILLTLWFCFPWNIRVRYRILRWELPTPGERPPSSPLSSLNLFQHKRKHLALFQYLVGALNSIVGSRPSVGVTRRRDFPVHPFRWWGSIEKRKIWEPQRENERDLGREQVNETVEKVKVHLFPGPRRRRWGVSSRANNKKSLPAEAVLCESGKRLIFSVSPLNFFLSFYL